MSLKEFQYEKQSYQEDCIYNVIHIFEGIHLNQGFNDVIESHLAGNNYPKQTSPNKNIDILMETGTGKTFTYIKTIFELNRNFGYKKFIVLVPSVPIREGTRTNFQDTKNYFKAYYANNKDKEIEAYFYESGKISEVVGFINNSNLSCLVMTPASFDKDKNILNRPLERDLYRENVYSFLDVLKQINPIVIIDEPHKFEGEAFKKYFSGFNNYYLRYGATFPVSNAKKSDSTPLSNIAYILDSISAFRQNLVKRITVHTQDIVSANQVILGISGKTVTVNNFQNGEFIGKSVLKVGNTFNGKLISKINKNNIVLSDGEIITPDYSLSDEAIRIMIADTIKIHLEKEFSLFCKGIKALSLFFIEGIPQFRDAQNPVVKRIFEEEYLKQRGNLIAELRTASNEDIQRYLKYLERDFDTDGNLQVHKGYFSGDKGNADEKIKQGVDEILSDKKKLLSFESPTRFIFSIWALQEGWDNPNVFTICKLSDNGSENSKLQQIGRGLRICVNQNLQRQNISLFNDNQEDFWAINNLDVVVPNQEVGFVESIQNEILRNSFLLNETFTRPDLVRALKEKNKFDDKIIRRIIGFLEDATLIHFEKTDEDNNDVYSKSDRYPQILKTYKDNPATIPAPLSIGHINAIENLFTNDIKDFVKDAKKGQQKKKLRIKDNHFEDFRILWQKINQNSLYIIDNLTEENLQDLTNRIASEINALNIHKIFLQHKKTIIHTGTDISLQSSSETATPYESKVDYLRLAHDLASQTKTPVAFIVKIINALSAEFKENMLKNDLSQAQKEMAGIIRKHLIGDIKAHINYCGIDGKIRGHAEIKQELSAGSLGKFQESAPDYFSLKEKWVFEDVIEYDSDFEKNIILQDTDDIHIQIFAKMPKLEIQTPLGRYNPDFCYAIEGKSGKKVFLVVESKGYDTATKIPEDERGKIAFARKFFGKVNEKYQSEGIKIMYEERINRTTLSTLIQEAIK
ncbi:MAG: DEAD/DEAH box helicase family protein [Proteiniphilum sp.]|uniref:restriction endonuclease n=1 Tax=Proteiniphilum sp. TaxID=1926877 RepID=UPI002ABC0A13|nr:DEAD/DEAH box helicase family protein [Proteiniphilum sp.]MDY9917326.1 DEAD/DEAH box helicase family protein [Proteiniphilum sp.]